MLMDIIDAFKPPFYDIISHPILYIPTSFIIHPTLPSNAYVIDNYVSKRGKRYIVYNNGNPILAQNAERTIMQDAKTPTQFWKHKSIMGEIIRVNYTIRYTL